MKRYVALGAGALLILGYATAVIADTPSVDVKPIFKSVTTVTGQDLNMPAKPEVTAIVATFPPGSRLPVHKHPYPHYAYVLQGVLTVHNEETGKTFDVKQGEFLIEMENTWHYGINNGTVPVKLLVIDQVPPGTKTNTIPKESE